MKISMWMILEKLEGYHPRYVIQNGEMCITGIRFVPESARTAEQSQYVYVRQENGAGGETQIDLINGCDQITFCGNNLQNLSAYWRESRDFNRVSNALSGAQLEEGSQKPSTQNALVPGG